MPTPTYTLIASSTVGSGGAANITFSSIASTYTDLCIKLSARNTDGSNTYNNIWVTFNNSSGGTSYSDKSIYAIGTTAGSLQNNSQAELRVGASVSSGNTSNTFSSTEIYIPNYASSNNKSVSTDSVTEANSGTNGRIYNNLMAGVRSNTDAITSITLTGESYSFVQYTTAYLYGIVKS